MMMILMMMTYLQILNHEMNMLELMMKTCTYLLLKHMWVVMMWVRKVNLIRNLMLSMRKSMG
jgi:hypothetical protein